MTNYYGGQAPYIGFADTVAAECRAWLNLADPSRVNIAAFSEWLQRKGISDISQRLAALQQNPNLTFLRDFVNQQMQEAGMSLGFIQTQQPNYGYQQPQQSYNMFNNTNSINSPYSSPTNTVQPQPVQQQQQPQQQTEVVPEPEQTKTYSLPKQTTTNKVAIVGSTGEACFYDSNDETTFCHLDIETDLAFSGHEDIVNYLQQSKPSGRCIVSLTYLDYQLTDIPTEEFKKIKASMQDLLSGQIGNLSDYVLYDMFMDSLKDVSSGTVQRLMKNMVSSINHYTTNRFLQHSSNIKPTILLRKVKDIDEILTNDKQHPTFKEVKGYKSRMREIMRNILSEIANCVIAEADEFGMQSPWLSVCRNIALPEKEELVKEVYSTPDKDIIGIQGKLADKYTCFGTRRNIVVVFDEPSEISRFKTQTKSMECSTLTEPMCDIEYVILTQLGGIEPQEILLLRSNPYVETFTLGETLDNIPVLTRW